MADLIRTVRVEEFDDFMDRVGLPRKRAIFNGCNVGAARPAGGPNIS